MKRVMCQSLAIGRHCCVGLSLQPQRRAETTVRLDKVGLQPNGCLGQRRGEHEIAHAEDETRQIAISHGIAGAEFDCSLIGVKSVSCPPRGLKEVAKSPV